MTTTTLPTSPASESSTQESPPTEVPIDLGRLRLAPGHHLVSSPEGWLLFLPSGSVLRLKVGGDVMEQVAVLLANGGAAAISVPVAVREVLERFVERSFAEVDPAATASSLGLAVGLVGDGPVAELLPSLLEAAGLPLAQRLEAGELPDASAAPDLVVACAGWLPDASWQRLGAWCVEHAVAWHGCYAEGQRFYLGPFWSPEDPATANYRDTRDRRLAAELHSEGLESYWRYLDVGERVPPVPWPDAGGIAVIAGTLASDLIAVARGERPPSHGHQLAFDPRSGTWRRHPVLPVPRGLMTESLP